MLLSVIYYDDVLMQPLLLNYNDDCNSVSNWFEKICIGNISDMTRVKSSLVLPDVSLISVVNQEKFHEKELTVSYWNI